MNNINYFRTGINCTFGLLFSDPIGVGVAIGIGIERVSEVSIPTHSAPVERIQALNPKMLIYQRGPACAERIDFKGIVEPVKYLCKNEVRNVGAAMGLPAIITHRQPFSGPGVAVRRLGELTREKLEILREADALFLGAMEDKGYASQASQFF